MLNDRQRGVLISRINEDVDLPLISERREERMIERTFELIGPKVEPSLRFLLPEVYVDSIKLALDETLELDQRVRRISDLMRGELAEPLTRELNSRVDCPVVPEKVEGMFLRFFSKKLISEFVEWTVGKVDEKLSDDDDADQDRQVTPGRMLNERQRKAAISRMNEDMNIPLVSEEREERWIQKGFDLVEPSVEPALRMLMSEVYLDSIKLALNESLPLKERRKRISHLIRGELAEPLSRELNKRVDCTMIPEKVEGILFKIVSRKIIDEFVEWTVGKVDEKILS